MKIRWASALRSGGRQGGERLAGEIVGIVGDVRQRSLSAELTPHVYVAFDQWPLDELTVVMRTRGDPAAPLRAAQATVARLDRDLPVYDAFTLETMVDRSLGQPRFYVTLLTVFADPRGGAGDRRHLWHHRLHGAAAHA